MKKIFFEIISSLRSKEIKIHATSLWMQMGAVLLNLFTNLLLARIMLPEDYGAFAYSSTLIFVLAGLGSFGTLNVLVREVSAAAAQNNTSLSNNLLFWASKRSIVFLFLTLSVFIFISLQFNLFFGTESMTPYRYPILVSLLSVPLLTNIYISQSYLQGLSKIFSAQFAEKLLKPFLFLAFAASIYILQKKIPLSFSTVALINPLAFLIALIAIFMSVRKSLAPTDSSLLEKNISERWKKSSLTFFFFNAVTLIFLRTDMLALGFFENTEQIGIYNISCRVADIVSFPLHIISFGLSPLISGFFLSEDKRKLQQTVTASVRIIFFLSVIPAIILFFF
ncbi:MAG: oligosaccharide flippase family protein, partial [Bacteroidia bacterium]|nr:oligosaccharide flippase family protein [Bacteroidia bacterium]